MLFNPFLQVAEASTQMNGHIMALYFENIGLNMLSKLKILTFVNRFVTKSYCFGPFSQ